MQGRGLVERLLSKQRPVLLLDPLSVWWRLNSAADGKSSTFRSLFSADLMRISRCMTPPGRSSANSLFRPAHPPFST
jgi:hypothetical protein